MLYRACAVPIWFRGAEPPEKDAGDDDGDKGEGDADKCSPPLSLGMPSMKRHVSSQEDFEALYGLSSEEEAFECFVCMDEVAKFEGDGFAMECGHWACVDCWAGYVSSFVNDGARLCSCGSSESIFENFAVGRRTPNSFVCRSRPSTNSLQGTILSCMYTLSYIGYSRWW